MKYARRQLASQKALTTRLRTAVEGEEAETTAGLQVGKASAGRLPKRV